MSTTQQDLERQVHALEQVGIEVSRICVDKDSGSTTDRPGLRAALAYARAGDVLVDDTTDRPGRTARDRLTVIHDLAQDGPLTAVVSEAAWSPAVGCQRVTRP